MSNLYKIKHIDERNVKNIENDEIWIPRVSDLNDPYDCAVLPYHIQDISEDELRNLTTELINKSKLFRNALSTDYFDANSKAEKNIVLHKYVCSQIQNIGVCSFLDSATNIVTWSHYGDNHRGMCLEYSWINEVDGRSRALMKGYRYEDVSYVNIAPRYFWHEFMKAPELGLRLCLSTKFKDWAYENETRLLTYDHEGGSAVKCESLNLRLSKVYFGCNSPETPLRRELEAICSRKRIQVTVLNRLEYNYSLQDPQAPQSRK